MQRVIVAGMAHEKARNLATMGRRPTSEHSIERASVDGNYEPENCVWATQKEQARNKRNTRWIEYSGQRKSLSEWAEIFNIKSHVIAKRLKRGWSFEQALGTFHGLRQGIRQYQ